MKFTVETSALAAALKIASVAMVGGMQLPILGNIKIEATENQLILSTTNLDIYVIQKVAAEVAEGGVTTAAFGILQQLVNRMDASTVTIETKESALQTCSIFADNKVPGLQLAGKNKEIEVSQPGKASAMVMGAELNGQPDISIRLNARYLVETLGVMEADSVRIQCKDANSPVMIEEGPVVAVINRLLSVIA